MIGARYVIQHFDFADGGRSWHVYDSVKRCHIHTTTHGFLNDDKSEPICCTKICTALNYMEAAKRSHNSDYAAALRVKEEYLRTATPEQMGRGFMVRRAPQFGQSAELRIIAAVVRNFSHAIVN